MGAAGGVVQIMVPADTVASRIIQLMDASKIRRSHVVTYEIPGMMISLVKHL